MAYDAAHSQILFFGGGTWVWDGTNWTPKMPQTSPPDRVLHAMAYDAGHDQVVLFGGENSGVLSDTWVWTHGIFASAGNPQSTPAGAAFSFPLEVTVVDNTGAYVNGAQVTFTGPPGMVSFSSTTAMTGVDGRAGITATATANTGSYLVTASLSSGDFTEFLLSNVNPANATGACQVTTALDDNSAGSLRSQVATCGKGGTITFASGLTRVVVSQGQDIQFIQNLTINGGSGVTIDAGSSSRIFFMFGGAITLTNLTLQNGLAKGGDGGNGDPAGGGAAGMGGAVFVNGGTLISGNVIFSGNRAQGGSGGSGFDGAVGGGGGGVGGSGATVLPSFAVPGNGGGGGDFGTSGGSGGDGSGGSAYNSGGLGVSAGHGGFGAGGGADVGGFGGDNNTFGGVAGASGNAFLRGSGAGLGGAIFVRNGLLVLEGATFSSNSAIKGTNGDAATDGQGKGGALFVMNTAAGIYFGAAPAFTGDSATDAGMNTACNTVVGADAVDTNDVCGILQQASIATTSGSGQSTTVSTAFTHPLVATVTPAVSGVPIIFTGPATGASTNPGNNPATTNASGVASAMVTANATAGGPYTVTATDRRNHHACHLLADQQSGDGAGHGANFAERAELHCRLDYLYLRADFHLDDRYDAHDRDHQSAAGRHGHAICVHGLERWRLDLTYGGGFGWRHLLHG